MLIIAYVTGWTLDEDLGTFVNDEQVMDEYFAKRPNLECFRHAGPAHRVLL